MTKADRHHKVYGPHGLSVRLTRAGGRIVARWTEQGQRRKRSWHDTADHWRIAQAWAEGFSEQRQLRGVVRPSLTLRQLWERFITAQDHLRPRTVELYRQRWRKLELFAGREQLVDEVTLGMMDSFRLALKAARHAPNQVREIIRTAKVVFNWGEDRELVQRNRVGRYTVPRAKDEPETAPAEYRLEDFRAMQEKLDPQSSRQWRAWAVLTLVGNQGVRINAALRLRWEDVGTVLTWPGATDKVGRTWQQPIREETAHVLTVARSWRDHDGYRGPWVFFSSHRNGVEPYRVQAFWRMLQEAEKAAGVVHRPYRAAHGFRKMVVGEITARTGNPVLALQFVGDRDLKLAQVYVKERLDALTETAALLDGAP
jgi:integrase